jgi:hypothetical protein
MPESKRILVPELPIYNAPAGAFSPASLHHEWSLHHF